MGNPDFYQGGGEMMSSIIDTCQHNDCISFFGRPLSREEKPGA